jgi:hypothetical protein
MISALANIFVIVSYVGVLCIIAYKIMTYLMDKMFHLIDKSKLFRVLLLATLTMLFFVFGWFQMSDYYAGEHLELTRAFPFTLGLSAVLLYFTFWAYKDQRQGSK